MDLSILPLFLPEALLTHFSITRCRTIRVRRNKAGLFLCKIRGENLSIDETSLSKGELYTY